MKELIDGNGISETLMNECKIMYGKEVLTGDEVLRDYMEFLINGFFSEKRRVLFTLHTGSLCFDVLSILIATLNCIYREIKSDKKTDSEFGVGDIVVYKNQRYRWKGKEKDPLPEGEKGFYCILVQDAKGKNGPSTIYVEAEDQHLIRPYYGSSVRTDGMGLKKKKSNREDFLSFLFDVPLSGLPVEVCESAVIVSDRGYITNLIKNISIRFGEKTVSLEDLCPASYFTSSGEEYQIGSNQLKLEPVLKVTGSISSARELILNRNNNASVFIVIGAISRTIEDTELGDLLNRKSLQYVNISGILNPHFGKYAVEHVKDNCVFACTKDYLEQFSEESLNEEKQASLLAELHNQEKNIMRSTVSFEIVKGGWTWEQYREIRNKLKSIKNLAWDEKKKNKFIVIAYSLINLLNTAPFSMEYLESAIDNSKIHAGVVSPEERIEEMRRLSDDSGTYRDICKGLTDEIEAQYKAEFSISPKLDSIKKYIYDYFTNTSYIAIVVPKAYYADLLRPFMIPYHSATVDIVTPSRFNSQKYYDGVLAIGNFKDRLFDPLTCKTAAVVVSFLYDNERKVFSYKKEQIEKIDRDLNKLVRGSSEKYNESDNQENTDNVSDSEIGEDIKAFEENDDEIEMMPFIDFPVFCSSQGSSGQVQPFADVTVTGTFLTGEMILFTKYYKAVVYDPASARVVEKNPESIMTGDTLVFMSRDSFTKNTVDTIYDQLLSKRRFNKQIVEATEKAEYWKEALREYKSKNNLTYREIAQRLRKCGSSIQEMAVRQWLSEDSHIVGPRDEKMMRYVAIITEDPYISADPAAYFESCRLVRKERRDILRLIGLAITEKLKGTVPKNNEILKDVWENVDRLSEELEIDRISVLNDPVSVPIGLVNKPIDKKENLL